MVNTLMPSIKEEFNHYQNEKKDEERIKKVPYPYIGNSLSEEEKILIIEYHFKEILQTLGMDLSDDSLQKTPSRYAKMIVNELFSGLTSPFPTITTQENKFNYNHPVIELNISIYSVCEHHFVPIIGHCHIAYVPRKKVIGLSKLNRIAHYFCKRPQVQERLTQQISIALIEVLETEDVAVVMDATHLCICMRGVQDQQAFTRTMDLKGSFLEDPIRRDFLQLYLL